MSAIDIVRTKLAATPAIVAIVGKRIRPIAQDQADLPPIILINIVASVDTVTLAGAGQYFMTRVQVECIAVTPTAVVTLGDAVMAVLNGVIKEQIASCVDVDILHAGTDFTEAADDRSVFRRVLQFRVHWRRA